MPGAPLLTARELGERLIREGGDRPVKLRIGYPFRNGVVDVDSIVATILVPDAVVVTLHSASGTEWGDLPEVCRVDVRMDDNA